MAINVVSSAAGAAVQATQQTQTQKTDSAKAADEAAKALQAQLQAQKPEQAKPTVNAEGQTTGQIISVTA